MDANLRLQQIKAMIDKSGEVKISELEEVFPDYSTMTIRRDLEKLEAQGEIVRTRSGAKSIAHLARLNEPLYSQRASINIAEKAAIAKKAQELMVEGSSIFLDTGTTVTALAKLLVTGHYYIVTTAPNIALECAKNNDISVFITGGQLSSGNLSVSGAGALSFLDQINIDIAFMATSGVTLNNGFAGGNYDEGLIKKRVIEKAGKTIMLMDSTKYGKSLPFTFATLGDIDTLITDDKINKEFTEKLEELGIEVIF